MIDSHTHLNFEAFAKDWQEVVERSIKAGLRAMVVVGTDVDSSKRAIEMAEKNKYLYAAVGIHPHHVQGMMNYESGIRGQVAQIRLLAEHPRVVAIGEVGLDYHEYRMTKYELGIMNKNLQKQLLGAQIQIAKEVNKPVILHSREAGGEVLDVIEHFCKSDGRLPAGVWHCFDGSKKYSQKILDKGFYVSFTGNVTYVADRAEVARGVPLERLLLETDCPYMSPVDKGLRSEPKDVKIIGQFHGRERGMDETIVFGQTGDNARRLFKLKS